MNYALTSFCLDKDNLVTTNGCRLIVAKNLDVPPVKCQSYHKKKSKNCQHLLNGDIVSLLPKSGVCRVETLVEHYPVLNSVTRKPELLPVSCLYIGLPDYHIWTTSVEGAFPKWRDTIATPDTVSSQRISIDRRDAQVCLKQLVALPRGDENAVYFHFEDGRLCVDSTSHTVSNARLRFSEFTTGEAFDFMCDAHFFCDTLRVALGVCTGSIEITKIERDIEPEQKVAKYSIIFECDDVTIFVACMSLGNKMCEVTGTVEMKDHWTAEKSVKQSVKKQVRPSALFVDANREIIASLRLENEKLKEKLKSLQNKNC
jgi:hypothetical protein